MSTFASGLKDLYLESMELKINTLEEIGKAAKDFVENMGDHKLFAFYGKMGAGKTTFIKAICEELGVTDVINSPTFSIVNEYLDGNGKPIYHFDFYRIKNTGEVYDIGFDDYIYSGAVCFMEWPELVEDLLPDETVRVDIVENSDQSRTIKAQL